MVGEKERDRESVWHRNLSMANARNGQDGTRGGNSGTDDASKRDGKGHLPDGATRADCKMRGWSSD